VCIGSACEFGRSASGRRADSPSSPLHHPPRLEVHAAIEHDDGTEGVRLTETGERLRTILEVDGESATTLP
jgi:hypothetical protein